MKNEKVLQLRGTGNNKYLYRYEIIKSSATNIAFINFLKELGFTDDDIMEKFFYEYETDKKVIIKLSKLAPFYYGYLMRKQIGFDVELFSKKDSLLIIIRTKNHAKLTKAVEKFMKFPGEP